MLIATSQLGININYKCYRLPDGGRRCKNKNTNVCYTCEYCKAELSAKDATKLITVYRNSIIDSKKEG